MHRMFTGVVVSAKEDKTIHVAVTVQKLHPKYRKHFDTTKTYAVHDEKKQAALGDTVVFEECRPLSKTKRWYLKQIIRS